MRHGTTSTKLPLRNIYHRNAPGVRPPGLLSLFSAFCILSVVGTLFYSVIVTTVGAGGYSLDPVEGLVVAVVHFLLPILIAYTVSTNSAWSRSLIALYSIAAAVFAIFGVGYIAPLIVASTRAMAIGLVLLAIIFIWLFASPKMRIYYLLISGRPIPSRLSDRARHYVKNPWPGPRLKRALEWAADHLETVVLLGLIVAVVLALLSTNPANFS